MPRHFPCDEPSGPVPDSIDTEKILQKLIAAARESETHSIPRARSSAEENACVRPLRRAKDIAIARAVLSAKCPASVDQQAAPRHTWRGEWRASQTCRLPHKLGRFCLLRWNPALRWRALQSADSPFPAAPGAAGPPLPS